MSALGLLIIVLSLFVCVGVFLLSHGQVVLIALPLMIGLPLAGLLGPRRR